MMSPSDKIHLVEVFHSVQGEGYWAGRAAVFVRFAGCNLSCVFADGAVCDTPYQRALLKPTLDELFHEIIPHHTEPYPRGALEHSRVMMILTGGEPTLHPAFDEVVQRARRYRFYVAVETNGTKWRPGLGLCDWISCSPKYDVRQGSPYQYHNHNPQSTKLSEEVMNALRYKCNIPSGEYRYVVGADPEYMPYYFEAWRHYVSPAVLSDGSGQEWRKGFPGFVPGAVARCLAIVQRDPRWQLSIQSHKILGVE